MELSSSSDLNDVLGSDSSSSDFLPKRRKVISEEKNDSTQQKKRLSLKRPSARLTGSLVSIPLEVRTLFYASRRLLD
jgi:hypothetical protein